jgi:periplasmic divalent cation tolerance protein
MAEETLLVLSTFGSAEEARRVARTLVEERLVACANLLPGVESIYRWQGVVEEASEVLVLFKTNLDRYWQVESRLRELHSYEVPEILAFRAHAGLPAYLRWVFEACMPAS